MVNIYDQRQQRPGRPVFVSNPQTVTNIVRADYGISIRMFADTIKDDKETVRKILHDELNMKKVGAKLFPKT